MGRPLPESFKGGEGAEPRPRKMADMGWSEHDRMPEKGYEDTCRYHRLRHGMLADPDMDCDRKPCYRDCPLEHPELRSAPGEPRFLEDLRRVVVLADEALAAAKRQGVGDAVNWARVRCVTAELCLSHEGDVIVRAWIGHASPDAFELQRFVQGCLDEHGFVAEVRTEW